MFAAAQNQLLPQVWRGPAVPNVKKGGGGPCLGVVQNYINFFLVFLCGGN